MEEGGTKGNFPPCTPITLQCMLVYNNFSPLLPLLSSCVGVRGWNSFYTKGTLLSTSLLSHEASERRRWSNTHQKCSHCRNSWEWPFLRWRTAKDWQGSQAKEEDKQGRHWSAVGLQTPGPRGLWSINWKFWCELTPSWVHDIKISSCGSSLGF